MSAKGPPRTRSGVLEARGGSLVLPVAQRGYHVVYRGDGTDRCPGCDRQHFIIGRFSAECAFCGTAVMLPAAPLIGGGATPRRCRAA